MSVTHGMIVFKCFDSPIYVVMLHVFLCITFVRYY